MPKLYVGSLVSFATSPNHDSRGETRMHDPLIVEAEFQFAASIDSVIGKIISKELDFNSRNLCTFSTCYSGMVGFLRV